MDLNRWVCGYHRKIWFLPTRQNKAQLLLSFTLLTWVFTGSVFTSAPPADTMLGETPPNSTEPYRIKTCVLYFHPKDKYKHHIDVTNWSNSSDDRHTNTYIYNRGVSDWPCWRGSVCRCRSAVGCGTPSPRCGPGASSSGWWWRLSPRCSGSPPASIWGQRKKWVWVLVFRSRDEILDGILHQKASSPLIIHTNGSYLELQRLID